MRITGGIARGIPLRLPSKGEIRPATDYLREAVFSSLGGAINGARVLDLFAGTGAYGVEAVSRGAARADWVEKNRAAAVAFEANRAAVAKSMRREPAELGAMVQADAFAWNASGAVYDFIFADPPYALLAKQGDALIARAAQWLAPEGTLVLEAPGEWQPALGAAWVCVKRLSKGARQPSALFVRAVAKA